MCRVLDNNCKMGNNVNYFLFLLWLCYLIVSSILLFTQGFLLTRIVQDKNNTCVHLQDIECTDLKSNARSGEHSCSENEKIYSLLEDSGTFSAACLPSQKRVVLLIVDALRYDFTIFDENIKNPLPFQNKMPIINELIKSYPQHSRHYKFIADPPTTTMQRIKGLTTGSLPTFVDAGSNFATMEINEDNIIDQMIQNNYNIVFMGDDTWNGLYPNRFIRNYPYPSFNVWDLDTVDNGVRDHLYAELNSTDWNLLIGHFLGVDHCGHRYGPHHSEMERKLREINIVIENVVEQMDNNTILFVIGDHGMTSTGDHGGESEDEVTAGFFVYSKEPFLELDRKKDSIKQVDIVPTLATILGIPIPFQNLGILVLDCLTISSVSHNMERWRLALYYLWVNVNQVLDYIKEYSVKTNTFNEEILENILRNFPVLKNKFYGVDEEQKFFHVAADAAQFIFDLRKMCEDVWIQFDSFSMSRGLLFLFISIFFVFLITDGITYDRLLVVFTSSFVPCSYVMLLVAAGFGLVLYYYDFIDNVLSSVFFATAIISQIMFVIVIVQNWEVISLNWYNKNKTEKMLNLICRVVLIFNLCELFSNSYIIEESFVVLFLLITVIIVGALSITASNKIDHKRKGYIANILKWPKLRLLSMAIIIAMLVRTSMYFWRCREEQQWCFANPHQINNITLKMEATKVQWGIAVVSLALFVFVTKEWLRSCGNLNGYHLTVTMVKFVPTAIVVCIAGYWVLRRVHPKDRQLSSLKPDNVLAWTVFTLTSLGLISTVIKPLCTYIIREKDTLNECDRIPNIFEKIKKSFVEKEEDQREMPIICGLATIYSSVFIILGIYMILVFGLLLNDTVAPSAIIMFLTAIFVLIIMSALRIEKVTSIEQLFDVPNLSILVWIILAQYFFYGSGHQPTFPNISWEAAFIGTSGNFTNYIVPGTLIILNTFCSHIFMGLMLPLLLITPFTIFVMIPSLVGNKKSDLQLASSRGEVVLINQDKLTLTAAFVLSCKYIIGHGIRVFASMLAATVHSRHLMIWKIFAPKFIFESIGMFVTLASVIVGYLILIRINKKVWNLIVILNKLN